MVRKVRLLHSKISSVSVTLGGSHCVLVTKCGRSNHLGSVTMGEKKKNFSVLNKIEPHLHRVTMKPWPRTVALLVPHLAHSHTESQKVLTQKVGPGPSWLES